MNKIKNIARKTYDHYDRNRVSYALGAVAIAAIVLQQRNLKAFYAFLGERGIDPMEFYCPEAYAELNN